MSATFEQLSAQPHMPILCPVLLPAHHPICSGQFPGVGTPNPLPLSPVPEPAQWLMLAAGLVAIAIYRKARR